MLLYGPPGTGKTLIARQIGKLLKGKEPKVVNGPEILNKFVGESEANVRALFKDAEADEKGNGKTLHIIIFDEIDAICKQRGTMSGSTGVHDTVVNQLLSKIDGVNSLNNILVIGMTNRKDMIDSALLRPGRLEVHIEIGLPDAHGREQILNIHTKKMRENKKLDDDVSIRKLAEATKNFSGAELEGLVKSASSFALYQCVDVGGIGNGVDVSVKPEDIVVNMAHFERALMEVTPAFGIADDELKTLVRGPLIDYSAEFERLKKIGMTWVGQVRNSRQTPLLSVLLEGAVGAGKTALAGKLAIDSDFAFTKVISPEMFVGFSEQAKCAAITKVFDDAYKCPLSCVILDNIERLVEYVALGPRFGNQVLQTLLVLIKRVPPGAPDRKLLILATTSSLSLLRDMEFHQTFNVVAHMPSITRPDDIVRVFEQADVHIDEKEMNTIAANMPLPVGIKQLLMIIEMATVAGIRMTAARFLECIRDSGLDARRTPNRSTTQSDTS
jgi:vesicle-fusing ATPase